MKIQWSIALILISLASIALAQQNPNADRMNEEYQQKLENHENSMGETVHDTYTARDPWQEKKDDREEAREERRDFRRQLRLERARRPRFNPYPRRRGPWDRPYPYVF